MDQDPRMNALCNRLGHLWTKTKRAVVDGVVTEDSLKEGERTVFGRLYGNPNVNFQAFQSTMKKAWKSDKVICTHLELGLFSFVFESVEEKNRILESGPWSFSRHLLVLKPWEPTVIPQCSTFDSCAFWLHIIGLPVEGRNTEVIHSIAEQVGKVVDVKMETKGYAAVAVCKAKVVLNLLSPLEPGMIYSYKGKDLWIDFRYERLPIFCFSCGNIGHYAQNCIEIPYDEDRFSNNNNIFYGTWLKTEMNTCSPYWKSFYEAKTDEDVEEETIPETPVHTISAKRKEGDTVLLSEERGKRKMSDCDGATSDLEPTADLGGAIPLLIELPSFHDNQNLKKNQKKWVGRETKKGRISKTTEEKGLHFMLLDESNLLETSVGSAEEPNLRALVACPNKPPGHK